MILVGTPHSTGHGGGGDGKSIGEFLAPAAHVGELRGECLKPISLMPPQVGNPRDSRGRIRQCTHSGDGGSELTHGGHIDVNAVEDTVGRPRHRQRAVGQLVSAAYGIENVANLVAGLSGGARPMRHADSPAGDRRCCEERCRVGQVGFDGDLRAGVVLVSHRPRECSGFLVTRRARLNAPLPQHRERHLDVGE